MLVVGPSWVGDMVMIEPLLALLKQRRPAPAIDVLAPAWSRPLLARMPQLRRAIDLPIGHGALALGERWRLGRSLRGQYRQAIVLPGSWKSALIPFFARIRTRTGFVRELRYGVLNDARRLDKRALPMTVQRFAALGLDPGAPLPTDLRPRLQCDPAAVAGTLAALGLDGRAGRALVLCVGAEYGPAKRWPAQHFAAVARHYRAQGWQVWLLGSAKDAPAAAAVNAAADDGCVDLAGRTNLGQACDLIAAADLVVSNDSGLMHVAAALGRPLVAVYGSSAPGFTPPLSDRARVLSLGLPCSPCFERECPLGHLRCLNDLAPAQVLAAAAQLLA
ncbi:MAG TPA: lipopolysaccharide heptosyltransferase II [Immundisolibacter sp.]|nr:lipopolysaccharide heptosyltransferase II [Immundisolibacter sp.]